MYLSTVTTKAEKKQRQVSDFCKCESLKLLKFAGSILTLDTDGESGSYLYIYSGTSRLWTL